MGEPGYNSGNTKYCCFCSVQAEQRTDVTESHQGDLMVARELVRQGEDSRDSSYVTGTTGVSIKANRRRSRSADI